MRLATFLILLAMCTSRPGFAAEEKSPDASKSPAAGRQAPAGEAKPPSGDAKPPAAGQKPPAAGGSGAKATAPPPAVRLPAAGEKKCAEIIALAGSLHGRPVLAEDPEVKDARITVTKAMAGQLVSR